MKFDIKEPIKIVVNIKLFSSRNEVTPCKTSIFRNNITIFNERNVSDLVIKCEDKEFYALKAILSSYSTVFDKMFSNQLSECLTDEVIINDRIDDSTEISADNVYEFLHYIYFGYSDKLDEMKEQLLYLAEKYEIIDLKNICQNYCLIDINYMNAIQLLILFDRYNCIESKNETIEFIAEHLNTILEQAKRDFDFININRSDLVEEICLSISKIIRQYRYMGVLQSRSSKDYKFNYYCCQY